MKERSKEKIAELVMDELITQLSERGNVRKLLGDMTGLPIGPLVEDLIREFEEIVERYRDRSLAAGVTVEEEVELAEKEPFTPSDSPSTPLPVIDYPPVVPVQTKPTVEITQPPDPEPRPTIAPAVTKPEPLPPTIDDFSPEKEKPAEKVSPPPPVPPQKKEPVKDVTDFRSKLEELARRVENEYLQKLEQKAPKRKPEAPRPPVVEPEPEIQAEKPSEKPRKREAIDVGPGEGGRPSRIPFRIDDQEYMYIHGVMVIPPGDIPCEHPFMLEEKGIDGKEFAFAVDALNLRFFLSRINQKEMNVSRKGVLLLGKSESIQLRGLHESILNELRAHGIVLPMEFGTVARGKADLQGLSSRFQEDLHAALARLAKTSWWTLTLSVLDGRIAQLFAEETGSKPERDGRQRERVSYSAGSLQAKKFDVKLLEKILQKEKRLAESVHQELGSLAERSEVQSMVGLGSGSSDDWKLILQASYLVSGTIGYQRFTRAVTDLQYRHILFEPMLSITGDAEDFSVLRK
jgi:hypothetical protein